MKLEISYYKIRKESCIRIKSSYLST